MHWHLNREKVECGDFLLFYKVSPSVVAVTGLDLWGAVMAMGLVCTLYTTLVSKIHPFLSSVYLKVSSLKMIFVI